MADGVGAYLDVGEVVSGADGGAGVGDDGVEGVSVHTCMHAQTHT